MAAKVAYFGALMAAADYEQDGGLVLRSGPLTPTELAEDLLLSKVKSDLAVLELIHAGFLVERGGVLYISKWDEKAGENSTHRVRKHREKQRLETLHETVSETVTETQSGNALEKEEEEETEEDTLRVRADALSDFLLAEGLSAGVVGEHRALDATTWRYNNRASAEKLVSAYGLDRCKAKASAMFAAVKAGKIRNTGGQYPAVMLERVWEYRELQPQATHSDPLMDEFRRLG